MSAACKFYCARECKHAHQADKDAKVAALVLDAQLRRYRDLPRNVQKLHALFTEVDLANRFRLARGEIVFNFGKHAGRLLSEVARVDPDYLEWVLASDFLDDVKKLVSRALAEHSEPD